MCAGGELYLWLLRARAEAAAKAGDAPAAQKYYGNLLEASRQESGPDHPDTLIAQYNKAHWTGMAGTRQTPALR